MQLDLENINVNAKIIKVIKSDNNILQAIFFKEYDTIYKTNTAHTDIIT